MASATTEKPEKPMASDVIVPGAGEEKFRPQPPPGQGFFHIYKSGQGYWTRMGTAAGAVLLGLLTADFVYRQIPPQIEYLNKHRGVALWISLGFLAAYSALVWWVMNKPRNADFLIATDSEMKKVNWTSRKDLIGSTKVVIFFMFLIAFLLFAIDVF